jgi:toxin ParE1/3/4
VAHRVVLRRSAFEDLNSIFTWIAVDSGAEFAEAYVRRIRNLCYSLSDFPNRGAPRPDLGPKLRTVVFERKAIIAYTVEEREVQIVRVLHHGRDIQTEFSS